MPASPTARNPTARSPIRARASPTPASAKVVDRAAFQRDVRQARSARTPARGSSSQRASASTRDRAPRAIAAKPVRQRAFPTEIRRQGPTRREARARRRPYTARRRPQGDRPYSARPPRDGERPWRPPERKFGGDKKFSRGAPDRGPRKDFGPDRADRGESKPWQKRDASSPDHVGRNSRSASRREGSSEVR